jgi:hypothetical protein
VRLRRFGGVGGGLADMEKQGIGHSLKRTRTLHYLITSLIKIIDTHVVYIRYLSPSSRRSFLLFSSCANFSGMQQPSSSSLQQHRTRIHQLVAEERAAGHGHAAGHALGDRPPAGVRDERTHSRVPQHGGLRRPRHDEPGVGAPLSSSPEASSRSSSGGSLATVPKLTYATVPASRRASQARQPWRSPSSASAAVAAPGRRL